MDQDARALEMLQKPMAEPVTVVRALDETGNVGHDEAAIVAQAHDAEVWRERREGIVGDLRTRRRDARNQRGLAGVGKADQADIGEELQVQAEAPVFAGQAGLCLARRTIRGAHELRVAHPASPAACDQDAVTLMREIGGRRPGFRLVVADVGDRADWDGNVEICASGARAIRSLAGSAMGRLELGVVAEVDQRVEVGARDEVDGSAVAAVAAIRAAARNELLAAETQCAASAVPGSDLDIYFIDKHRSVFGLQSTVSGPL